MERSEPLRWDDLPLFLAVVRSGTLSAGALAAGVTPSTMHRRIGSLEQALQTRLFHRHPTGLVPTAAGEALVPLAEQVESDVDVLLRAIAGRDQAPRGRVHLTAPETLVDLLVEPLAAFRQQVPGVDLQVTFADRFFDLARREADVALRPSPRPPESAAGRRIADVAWAVYGGDLVRGTDPDGVPWARYSGSLERLDASVWWRAQHGGDPVLLSVNGISAMQRVARCSPCRALLPCFVGDPDPELERLGDPIPQAQSALWLLIHPDLRKTARVRALVDHLWEALRRHQALFEGYSAGSGTTQIGEDHAR